MANPDKYTRGFSFTGYQANSPTQPLPGPKVDVELDNAAIASGEVVNALADIRRSDGMINNKRVRWDSLDDNLRLRLMQAGNPIIIESFDTVEQAALTDIPVGKGSVFIGGRNFAGDGGAAFWAQTDAVTPGIPDTGWFEDAGGKLWELAEQEPSVEMFGAISYGTVDQLSATSSVDAFDDCLAFCRAKKLRRMRAPGNYGFDRTWEIDTLPAGDSGGVTITIGQIKALFNFPAGSSSVVGKQPLIGLGRNNSSNFLNFNLHVNSLMGYNRGQDGIRFAGGGPASATNGFGAALCDIFIGHAELLNVVAHISGNLVGNPSNLFRGNRWAGNNVGCLFNGGTAGGSFPIVEGQRVYVDFISSNRWAGIMFLKDSRYHDVISQLDFNGQFCSELLVTSLTSAEQFETITGGTSGATGEILATYTWRGDRYILVAHATNAIDDASPFTAGETVSWPGGSATLTSIRTCSSVGATSWYFDIVLATQGTGSFHRGLIRSGYLGGVVGDFLHTDQINGANNHYTWNWQNGVGFDHSSTQVICRDVGISDLDTLFVATSEFFAPDRDVFLSGNRIYGSETANDTTGLPQNVATTVVDFSAQENADNGKAWLIIVHGIGAQAALGLGMVVMSSSGNFAIHPIVENFITLSMSGAEVQALQNAQANMAYHRTFLRLA